ncbi:hypothetical protein GCM10027435_30740 [Haloparvum alkalitolerans]|uniref:Uncharacterized protein n=1 Tax=Paenibacillus motobuensis TaxID=295324 RepID=A0ABP3HWG8_9BACL
MNEISKAIKKSAGEVNKYYEKQLKENPNWKPKVTTSDIKVTETNDGNTYSAQINIE